MSATLPLTNKDQKLVLVVEDDEEQLTVLRMILSDAGFSVITQSDADRVLHDVRELHPAVILMDVMLPSRNGLDGFALCSEIRRAHSFDDVKIIIVSAIAQGVGAQREKVRTQIGADDFFLKPFEPQSLVERINELVAA
jgi:two-component system alkaline phosphatase synthesis response regulator PhoP